MNDKLLARTVSRESIECSRSLSALSAPEAEQERKDLEAKISAVVDTLSFRKREIIRLRYGLGNGYAYTLEEAGRIFKVTRNRCQTLEAQAIKELRHSTEPPSA